MIPSIHDEGFEIIAPFLDAEEIQDLQSAIADAPTDSAHGIRNLLKRIPAVALLATNPKLLSVVEKVLGSKPFPVRGIFFDKTPDANWKVAWHQDLTIAVAEKKDVPGFGPWSVKDGVVHVQPPMSVLERMLTVRIHLDDCNEDNGPLQIIPGFHRHGRLDPATITDLKQKGPVVSCIVPEGGLLLMRPLLLHSSSPAKKPGHRRVIHIEYAAEELEAGLEWGCRCEDINSQGAARSARRADRGPKERTVFGT